MKQAGDWGNYYPVESSPFAYNETLAQEYFPLTKEQAIAKGWKWKEEVDEMPPNIPGSAIKCEITGKSFKLIPQEITFYERMEVPAPCIHPFERHRQRMHIATKFKLFNRNCQKCNISIQTTYEPKQLEILYCEECYLKEVY
jgi:hypothetical protein